MPLDGADWQAVGARGDGSGLSIFQVMPREMYFGASRATSIDLCVRDLVSFSRYRATTKIFAETVVDGFEALTTEPMPAIRRAVTFRRANLVARAIRAQRPDVVIVQQHLPTAAAIAMRVPDVPVILHTHSFQKAYEAGSSPFRLLRRAARASRYGRLSGILHVSDACRLSFAEHWAGIGASSEVVSNGLDFAGWTPAAARTREILFVGRCAPEKGVLETARAVAEVIPRHAGWRARFVLSAAETHPDYFRAVAARLAVLGERASLEVQRPFAEIKTANERAAIAVVASHCPESFGRTALEAHAGGAALLSSGSGALREVSGEAAWYLHTVAREPIVVGLGVLMSDETLRRRVAAEGAARVRAQFDIRIQAGRLDDFCRAIVSASLRAGAVATPSIASTQDLRESG